MSSLTRGHLTKLLGLPAPDPARWQVVEDRMQDDLRIRRLRIGPRGIPTLVLSPPEVRKTRLGILYCHAHGNNYAIGKTEALSGRPALRDPPLGLALAQMGAVVICPDLTGFGDRQNDGSESALAKAALWHGQSLLGQMAADLLLARAVLARLSDPTHLISMGISMGGTLAYLTAALDADITACAHLNVFANIAPLIASQAHDLHGPYLTIPGLLPNFDLADIAALVAPRPQFVFTGGHDPLTPDAATAPAIDRLTDAYANTPNQLTHLRDPHAGHHETRASRDALLAWIAEVAR